MWTHLHVQFSHSGFLQREMLAAAAALAGSSILEASTLVLTAEQPVLGRGKGLAALTKLNPCFSNTEQHG